MVGQFEADPCAFDPQRFAHVDEFSTVDIQVDWGTELDIAAYVKGVERSETYAYISVQHPTKGLRISTITHVNRPEGQLWTTEHHDWRLFEGKSLGIKVDGFLFEIDLGHPFALQRDGAEFCRSKGLDCSVFAREIHKVVRQQNELRRRGLPVQQFHPSVENPFIFLHHEKTAGSR